MTTEGNMTTEDRLSVIESRLNYLILLFENHLMRRPDQAESMQSVMQAVSMQLCNAKVVKENPQLAQMMQSLFANIEKKSIPENET